MKSGILAADSIVSSLSLLPEDSPQAPLDISSYQTAFDSSWIAEELHEVRNIRPSFHNKLGNWGGILYSGIDSLILKGRTPWTFHHPKEDWATTRPASLVFSQACLILPSATDYVPSVPFPPSQRI